MQRIMLKSKIHRARVTATRVDYEGSLAIDEVLLAAADILPGEQVWVLNMRNGERFITYAIKGRKGSGEMCLNGPAAHLGEVDDEILVLSFSGVEEEAAKEWKPRIVFVDHGNRIIKKKGGE